MKKGNFKIFILLAVMLLAGAVTAETLFEDNFDQYAAMTDNAGLAGLSADWVTNWDPTGVSDVKVGSLWPGLAYYSNNHSNDTELRLYEAQLTESLADYTVTVEAYEHDTYPLHMYAAGRIAAGGYVLGGAAIGSADPVTGDRAVYARVKDSDGASVGDYWVAIYDSTKPINIALTLSGASAMVTVTHNGLSKSLSLTTTVLAAGAPGFGGQWPWGSYSKAYFDNFSVTRPACGDPGVEYPKGDLNKDCQINGLDLEMLAAQWLGCTDPANPNCMEY
jgi:hypothetical protein